MNELQVVVDQKPGVIGFNFEEIRDELQARMDLYKMQHLQMNTEFMQRTKWRHFER